MPNAFSPNNDSRNDVLLPKIIGLEVVTRYEIYDRWGERVFFANDANKGWNGNFGDSDNKCATGVFIYYIETECEGGKKSYRGNITLIR